MLKTGLKCITLKGLGKCCALWDLLVFSNTATNATAVGKKLNSLLQISIIGGFLSGVIAFLIMLGIALNQGTAEALLNPSSGKSIL